MPAGSRLLARWPRAGEAAAGIAELEAAVAMWRELDDVDELASALDSLGWPFVCDSNNTRALEAFEQSLEPGRELATRRRPAPSSSASLRC